MAGQFSVGVIEYNAKESQGGWTTQYGNVLAKQIKLIVDKIRDKSNPSPVQFIALDQAKAESRTCTANDDTLVSCALEHNQLPGWTTIVSDCEPEQIELAYSKDWKLVAAPNTTNPLVDGYHNGRSDEIQERLLGGENAWRQGQALQHRLFRERRQQGDRAVRDRAHAASISGQLHRPEMLCRKVLLGYPAIQGATSKPSSAPTSTSQRCISSPPET